MINALYIFFGIVVITMFFIMGYIFGYVRGEKDTLSYPQKQTPKQDPIQEAYEVLNNIK